MLLVVWCLLVACWLIGVCCLMVLMLLLCVDVSYFLFVACLMRVVRFVVGSWWLMVFVSVAVLCLLSVVCCLLCVVCRCLLFVGV